MKIEVKPDGVKLTLSRTNLESLLDGLDDPFLGADPVTPRDPRLLKYHREDGKVTLLEVVAQSDEKHYGV